MQRQQPPQIPLLQPKRPRNYTKFGNLYYDEKLNKLYWDRYQHGPVNDMITLGDINDIDEITKNLLAIITKNFLNGEI